MWAFIWSLTKDYCSFVPGSKINIQGVENIHFPNINGHLAYEYTHAYTPDVKYIRCEQTHLRKIRVNLRIKWHLHKFKQYLYNKSKLVCACVLFVIWEKLCMNIYINNKNFGYISFVFHEHRLSTEFNGLEIPFWNLNFALFRFASHFVARGTQTKLTYSAEIRPVFLFIFD